MLEKNIVNQKKWEKGSKNRAEINEIENKHITERINKAKNQFLKRLGKRMAKFFKEKIYISNIRNGKGAIDPKEVNTFKVTYAHTF